jgi:catechol 2,3-dioxygenase-like lactoylglutathione lyase family enzyme
VPVRKLQHVALAVRDLDEALAFYAHLGFAPIPRPDFGFPGAWLQAELAQIHLTVEPDLAVRTANHLALEVDNIETLVASLEQDGLRVGLVPEVPGAGRQAFLQDPTGNLIELNQPA